VESDDGIFEHYGANEGNLRTLQSGVTHPADKELPARALAVFVGMLSLAAVPDCRILHETHLNHPR